ncbi:MAG TPA: PEP-CTERM sorting domain-containing protein [Deltaproteobacteria bacterium]|nr:PEP-CTERM sorting domain-containing protein [Deltaproteobacteria bacterium]
MQRLFSLAWIAVPGFVVRAFGVVLAMGWATAAAAVPVSLVVAMDPNEGGFGFSYLHDGNTQCSTMGGIEFCENGPPLRDLSGTLSGDLVGNVLSGISGVIAVAGEPDIVVTGGFVDFDASAPDTFGAQLETSTHGTFYFLDHAFAGAANSFNGVDLRLWGNNWNNTGTPDPGPFARYGLDLGITVIPEPGTALLLGLGLGVLAARRRV